MIASHRTPATVLMSAGGFVFFAAAMMKYYIFTPEMPTGIAVAVGVMFFTAIPLFLVGSCIYAKGIGYPFWIGVFGVTIVGLLILMLLPDRCPEDDDPER